MRYILRAVRRRTAWRRFFVERLTEPLHLNLISLAIGLFGGFRARVAFDLVQRPSYAFSLLRVADAARRSGLSEITAAEFGVAAGAGLLNMCEIARRVTKVTGVQFRILGFDTGEGMPPPRDYRDHPEYYTTGDFPMDPESLRRRLPAGAQLILGDIDETVRDVRVRLSRSAPLAFVSIDVDYYWSAMACLRILGSDARCYLPMVVLYVDDIAAAGHNRWCGELLAIEDFNNSHDLRKIAPYNFLRQRRVLKNATWIDHIYAAHILDHPERSYVRERVRKRLENPYL